MADTLTRVKCPSCGQTAYRETYTKVEADGTRTIFEVFRCLRKSLNPANRLDQCKVLQRKVQ